MSRCYTAFTLSEILLTLGIIGVIATITIPALINKTQDTELKTAWKKTFSAFANATSLIAQDNGGNLKGVFDLNGDGDVYTVDADNDLLRDKYAEKMQITKKCSASVNNQNCFLIESAIKKLAGGAYIWVGQTGYASLSGLVLSDGTLVTFNNLNANCSHGWLPRGACAYIQVDVNGFKNPNTIGKDIFGLFIVEDGSISPFGTLGDVFQTNDNEYVHDCDPNLPNTFGWSCSADYLYK